MYLLNSLPQGAGLPYQPQATFAYGSDANVSAAISSFLPCVKFLEIKGWNDRAAQFHFKRVWNADIAGVADSTKLRLEIARVGSANYFECYAVVNVSDITGCVSTIEFTQQGISGITAIMVIDFTDGNTTINLNNPDYLTYDIGGFSQFCISNIANFDVILPPYIYAVVGKDLWVYYDNLISCDIGPEWSFAFDTSYLTKKAAKYVSSAAGDETITLSAFPLSLQTPIRASSVKRTVSANAGNGLSKNVMVIGDSKTESIYKLAELVNLFDGDAMSVYFVGTLIGSQLDADDNLRVVYHEARSGWGIRDYHTAASVGGRVNPFYNPSKSTFDFSYYVDQNPTVGVPDIVFLDHGANDYGRDYDTAIKPAYDAIIASIHAFNPNIVVAICLQEGSCSREYQEMELGGGGPAKITLQHVARLIEDYRGLESSKIIFCPQYLVIDLENDFPMQELAVHPRNPHTELMVTDRVHFSKYGYYKLSDMYYAVIKYIGTM